MQSDRNLVLYDSQNRALWNTNTATHVDTPNIVIRSVLNTNDVLESGQALYSEDKNSWLTLESQCILVMRDKRASNAIVWSVPPIGNPTNSPCRYVCSTFLIPTIVLDWLCKAMAILYFITRTMLPFGSPIHKTRHPVPTC